MNNFCTKCGAEISSDSIFCTKCGTKKYQQTTTIKNIVKNTPHKRTPFWYLLSIFFGIIGGIIAYVILKNTDSQKAKRVLVVGIILTIPIFAGFGIGMVTVEENGTEIKVGGPFFVIVSGGMIPVLQVYDVIVVDLFFSFSDIEIGNIIVFDRPSLPDRVMVSRVVAITNEDPKIIRTQGDANPASIPGTDFPITEEEYIGKVAYIIPQVGYVTQILQPPFHIISILGFFVILFAILGLKHQAQNQK